MLLVSFVRLAKVSCSIQFYADPEYSVLIREERIMVKEGDAAVAPSLASFVVRNPCYVLVHSLDPAAVAKEKNAANLETVLSLTPFNSLEFETLAFTCEL